MQNQSSLVAKSPTFQKIQDGQRPWNRLLIVTLTQLPNLTHNTHTYDVNSVNGGIFSKDLLFLVENEQDMGILEKNKNKKTQQQIAQ